MHPNVPEHHPLRMFFAGSIESAFYSELGICSPELVGYLSSLLVEFLHVSDIYALKSVSGDRLERVNDMIEKAYLGPDIPEEDRERRVNRHVGDYILYWTGVYPECLRSSEVFDDPLHSYYSSGKRAYSIASELSTTDDDPSAETLIQLSEHFEDCAQGLQIARESWRND